MRRPGIDTGCRTILSAPIHPAGQATKTATIRRVTPEHGSEVPACSSRWNTLPFPSIAYVPITVISTLCPRDFRV
jgi:hypothetical protein